MDADYTMDVYGGAFHLTPEAHAEGGVVHLTCREDFAETAHIYVKAQEARALAQMLLAVADKADAVYNKHTVKEA